MTTTERRPAGRERRGPGEEQILELSFTSHQGGTRVDLTHEAWERLGERALEMRDQYDGGWDAVLASYEQRFTGSAT